MALMLRSRLLSRSGLLSRHCQYRPCLPSVRVFATAEPAADAKEVGSVNKKDLVESLSSKCDISQKKASEIISAFLDTVTDKVAAGERVTIVGFGTFSPRQRNARKGRNPSTGAPIDIPAKISPAFSAGKAFKDKVNGVPPKAPVAKAPKATAPKTAAPKTTASAPAPDRKATKSATKK